MLTLCIDTSYRYLTCCLIRDNEIISSYSEECFKKQSEEVFSALDRIFKLAGIKRQDIDSICVSKGPGSYTGIRIAMTIAKVIGTTMDLSVYTISTLRLYAGNRKNCLVVMDARAGRVYCGLYDKETCLLEDQALPVSEVEVGDHEVIGDGGLFDLVDYYGDIADDFLQTKPYWEKVDEIAYLAPEYLKESESYYR